MKFSKFAAALALAALLNGCSQETQQEVKDTGQAVSADVKEGAKEAMDTTKDAAADMDLTASVKTALMASDQIETGSLNVDTVEGTVFLKGSVPDEGQKTLAEEIAKNTVPEGTMIKNELVVGAADDTDASSTEGETATPDADGATPEAEAEVDPNATSTPVHSEGDGHDHADGDHTGHDHD